MTQFVIVTGCVFVAVSTGLPWVHVALLGDYNLFDAYDAIGRSQTVPTLLVVGAIVVALLALLRVRGHAIAALAAAGVALVRALPDLRQSEHLLRLLNPLLTRGDGPAVFLAGLAVVLLGAAASLLRRK